MAELFEKYVEFGDRVLESSVDESAPQTLLRKENEEYILELQTYDYCMEGSSTTFILSNDEVMEYLTVFQDQGLYDCMSEFLPWYQGKNYIDIKEKTDSFILSKDKRQIKYLEK